MRAAGGTQLNAAPAGLAAWCPATCPVCTAAAHVLDEGTIAGPIVIQHTGAVRRHHCRALHLGAHAHGHAERSGHSRHVGLCAYQAGMFDRCCCLQANRKAANRTRQGTSSAVLHVSALPCCCAVLSCVVVVLWHVWPACHSCAILWRLTVGAASCLMCSASASVRKLWYMNARGFHETTSILHRRIKHGPKVLSAAGCCGGVSSSSCCVLGETSRDVQVEGQSPSWCHAVTAQWFCNGNSTAAAQHPLVAHHFCVWLAPCRGKTEGDRRAHTLS